MSARETLPLYLASASPRRSQLLGAAGIAFEQFVTPVDEDALSEAYQGPLLALGEYLAREKALAAWRALRAQGRAGRVLASDTTVLIGGRSLAKPAHHDEAHTMLSHLRGREHTVATGVALIDPQRGTIRSATSATRVLMRDYSDEEIAAYVATGDPLDKAGAYSIQHPDFQPVATLAGCHLGVIGLPVCLVNLLLNGGRSARIVQAPPPHGGADCPWSAQCRPPYPFELPSIHTSALPDASDAEDDDAAGSGR
ncbi:MAG TPA: Maf family protein [Ktedonobacterales bacterium]|jgi:MAF protein|nr:Maf family protein [Ktedonobacterales bacterium]